MLICCWLSTVIVNKLSWAKLSQSWDLAKLLLSYITLVSDLDAFLLLFWQGLGFQTFFGCLLILIASEAYDLKARFSLSHTYPVGWQWFKMKKKLLSNLLQEIYFGFYWKIILFSLSIIPLNFKKLFFYFYLPENVTE